MLKHSKLLDKILKYITATILISVPLYPKFPFIGIPGTFVSIRLEDVLLAFAALYWLVVYFPGIKKLTNDKIGGAMLFFILAGLISLLSAILVTKTVQPHIGFLHWVRRIEYFIPFFVASVAIGRRPKDAGFYFKIILIVVVAAFIYGFGQRYYNWPIIITQNKEYSKGVALSWVEGSHISSTFAGHYDLASYLVMVMPIIVSTIFVVKDKRIKLLLAGVVFACLWLLVSSASRISLASYLMGVSLSLFLIKKYKAIPLVILISLIFVSFSSNLQARYVRLIEVGKEKIKNITVIDNFRTGLVYASEPGGLPEKRSIPSPTPSPPPSYEDRSTSIRLNVEWPRAIRALKKNFLLGTGYSSITLATDNDYLRLLGELGIIGFAAAFLLFANIFGILIAKFPLDKNFSGLNLALVAGYCGAFPGLLLNAVFIDIFEASKFAISFWLLTGIVVTITKKGK